MSFKLCWPNWPALRKSYSEHIGIFDKTMHNRHTQIIF